MVLYMTFGHTSGSRVGYSLVREVSSKNEFWDILGMSQLSSFDLTCRRQNLVLSFDWHCWNNMHSNSCWASFLGDFATEMKTTEKGDYKKAPAKWLFHRLRLISLWSLIRFLVFANFRPLQHSLEPWKCYPKLLRFEEIWDFHGLWCSIGSSQKEITPKIAFS